MKLLPLCLGTNCPSSVLIDIVERSLQEGDEAACPPPDVVDKDLGLGLDTYDEIQDLADVLNNGDRSLSSEYAQTAQAVYTAQLYIVERSLKEVEEAACPHEACPRLELVLEDPPIDVGDVDLDLGLDTEYTEDLTALLSDGDRSMSSDEDVVADLNLSPLDVEKLFDE